MLTVDFVQHNIARHTDPVRPLQVIMQETDLTGALSPCYVVKKSIKAGLFKF